MTVSDLALAAADRIIQANEGAYPITLGQVRRAAAACGLRVADTWTDASHTAGGTVTLRGHRDPLRTLSDAVHELAERLVQDPDPQVRHRAALRVEEHYRAAVRRVPEALLVGPAFCGGPGAVVRCEAPDRFDEEWGGP